MPQLRLSQVDAEESTQERGSSSGKPSGSAGMKDRDPQLIIAQGSPTIESHDSVTPAGTSAVAHMLPRLRGRRVGKDKPHIAHTDGRWMVRYSGITNRLWFDALGFCSERNELRRLYGDHANIGLF